MGSDTSVYSSTSRSAVRDRVDATEMAHGFTFPDWYLAMKANVTPLLGSAPAMARTAGTAGWMVGDVVERAVTWACRARQTWLTTG
jgi:hypothetical protein